MFTNGVQFSIRESIKYTMYRSTTKSIADCNQRIKIVEVGLRDGLQNEKKILNTTDKKQILDHIIDSGLTNIEIGSFVSPKWIPQLQNTDLLIKSIPDSQRSKLHLSALVPNLKGLQTAIQYKVDEIVLFVSVSDTFNLKNINCTTKAAFERFSDLVKIAHKNGIKVRGSISCCFECPYEGRIYPLSVFEIVQRFTDLGVTCIDIADTIGTATENQVEVLFNTLFKKYNPDLFACHYHDTNLLAIQNVETSYKMGLRTFHSSIAGLGGCPYSSKRAGNLDTTVLVKWAHANGIQTDVNIAKLEKSAQFVQKILM